VAVLPWVIEMIVRIVGAAIVADPVVAIDVRDVGMIGSVGVVTVWMLLRRPVIRLRSTHGRRVHLMASARGRAARMAFAGMLRQDGECEERGNGKTRDQ
jgi:hypothetical protein